MSQTNCFKEYCWLNDRLQYRYLDSDGAQTESIGYYENGQMKFRYTFYNEQLHGVCRTWFENGGLEKEESYCYGKKHGFFRQWYHNGTLKSEEFYREGQKHGEQKEWYPDGTLWVQGFFEYNMSMGRRTVFYPNGQLRSETFYRNNFVHGIRRQWDESGNLVKDELYIRGVRIPSRIRKLIVSRKLSAQHILKIRNSAVRRICLEDLGYERFLSQMPHRVINRDGDNELVRIKWHEREEPIYLVKIHCATTGVFYTLRVPPRVKRIKEAIAWTFGMKEKEYVLDQET